MLGHFVESTVRGLVGSYCQRRSYVTRSVVFCLAR